MWPAMPIFDLSQAIPVKSHVWKFGSDWLTLSRDIVSTNKQTNKHTNMQTNMQTYKQTSKKKKASKGARLWCARRGSYNNQKHWKIWESALFSGYYMWLKFHQNRRYLIFQGGRSPLLRGLTIIEKNWNYGNLLYLVAITYGLNVIKLWGI